MAVQYTNYIKHKMYYSIPSKNALISYFSLTAAVLNKIAVSLFLHNIQ